MMNLGRPFSTIINRTPNSTRPIYYITNEGSGSGGNLEQRVAALELQVNVLNQEVAQLQQEYNDLEPRVVILENEVDYLRRVYHTSPGGGAVIFQHIQVTSTPPPPNPPPQVTGNDPDPGPDPITI